MNNLLPHEHQRFSDTTAIAITGSFPSAIAFGSLKFQVPSKKKKAIKSLYVCAVGPEIRGKVLSSICPSISSLTNVHLFSNELFPEPELHS